MTRRLFLSYSRADASAVASLQRDLETGEYSVWFDRQIDGGSVWWEVICDQIRRCDVFVFVVSPHSIRSVACRAELDYAVAVDRRILPVVVRAVNPTLLPPALAHIQLVDVSARDTSSGVRLAAALSRADSSPPLPDPLPASPPAPIANLEPLRARVAAARLDYGEQVQLVRELQDRLEIEDQHAAIVELLRQLRERPDLAVSVREEIDRILSGLHLPADPAARQLVRSLVPHVRTQRLTPLIGSGLTDSMFGSRQDLATEWAHTQQFPMRPHDREDLPGVAQYVAVTSGMAALRQNLGEALREHIKSTYPELFPPATDIPLAELVRQAWRRQAAGNAAEPYTVLAGLRCPIYVSAHSADLLAEALRAREDGPEPVVEVCRWRPRVYDWPKSVFETEPDYRPSVDRPLVFHVFGHLDVPDSLVLTEDDYLQFLASVSSDPSLVPLCVQSAVVDSALLIVGFRLEEWDVRVLLHSLISPEGAEKLARYVHVAAQIDLSDSVLSPEGAHRYLERYFGRFRAPAIDIFWGSVDELTAALAEGTSERV